MSTAKSSAESPAAGRATGAGTKRPLSEDEQEGHKPFAHGRQCFVTVGATASFRQLLAASIESGFLKCLSSYGYDRLDVQCGPDYEWFKEQTENLPNTYNVMIRFFAYTTDMLPHMVECRGKAGHRPPGCIISHAGSGTILEALRYEAPLVVVPNPTLMDNHQAELAAECEKKGWAIYGTLGNLADAVRRSHERLAQSQQSSTSDILDPSTSHNEKSPEFTPPPYSPPAFPIPESERVTFFDWMVLTCYPEELAKQQHLIDLTSVEEDFAREMRQEHNQQDQSEKLGGQMDVEEEQKMPEIANLLAKFSLSKWVQRTSPVARASGLYPNAYDD